MGNSIGASGFGSSSTAEEVAKDVNLKGKVIIVTGANTGLGKETSRVLSKCGATVIMAARDVEKGKLAKEEIEKETNEKVHLIPLDLGDFSTIETFVDDFKKLNLPLHILINNAGVMATPQRKTKDGFEYQFGINHYGHFKLTMELLPMMVETAKKGDFEGRIVALSSMAHKSGTQKINFDDIHWTKPGSYSPWSSYGQSKLANILFAKALNRKLSNDKINITANALHPGVIATELSRDMPGWQVSMMGLVGPLFLKSIPQGSATTLFAATSSQLNGKGGLYLEDCNISNPIVYANDEKEQDKLWDVSEKECKISYPKFE